MGYADKGDRMTNSYSINRHTWKWWKKLLFQLFDLAFLKSYILFYSLGDKKILHSDFWNTYWGIYWYRLDRNRMYKGESEDHLLQALMSWDMKNVAGSIALFDLPREEPVCSLRGRTRHGKTKCEKCDVALCCDNTCFKVYHTKADRWNISGRSTGPPYVKLVPQLEM